MSATETEFRVETLQRLCRIPSAVPPGPETLIDPESPILADYVRRGPRAEFEAIGGLEIVELPLGQFAVRFGTTEGPCLALFAYTPTQHNNLMAEPWSGDVRVPTEHGVVEPCVFGQGVSQNKTHQTALIDLAKRLKDEGTRIEGTLWLVVNNEGRSSHACSIAAIEALPTRPDEVLQVFPTGLTASLGNRGRIDIRVHIEGTATHSSTPRPAEERVIDVASEFVVRLRDLDREVSKAVHPVLGRERATVYQMTFDPVLPHTMPARSRIIVDRRLLPDTDVDAAVQQIVELADALASPGCALTVEPHVMMRPALVEGETRLLTALSAAYLEVAGVPLERTVMGGTFDAGGPTSLGIPTISFGASGGDGLLGDDWMKVSDLDLECETLRRLIDRYFAP